MLSPHYTTREILKDIYILESIENYLEANDFDILFKEISYYLKNEKIIFIFNFHYNNESQDNEVFKTQYLPYDDLESIYQSLIEVKNIFLKRKKCNHSFIREVISEGESKGETHPLGHGVCSICGYKKKNVFSPLKNKRLVKGLFDEYITKQDWSEDTPLQCGKSGIVIGKEKSYRTAFFEAFPEVSGLVTFIRGEGNTIQEAESACFKKYEKMLNCKEHDFSRVYKNKERLDGTAICTKCNLFSTEALPPLTRCVVSNEITKNKINNEYITFKSYFDRDIETNFNNYKKYQNEMLSNLNIQESDEEIKEDYFYFHFEYYLFKKLSENNSEEILYNLKSKTTIHRIFGFIEKFIIKEIFELNENEFPNHEDIKIKILSEYLGENLNFILDYYNKNGYIDPKEIFSKDLIKKLKEI